MGYIHQLTVICADTDGSRAQFDGLNGVLHLKEAALGREGVYTSIVF